MFCISAIGRIGHDLATLVLFLLYLPIYLVAMVVSTRRILREIP
jgi:hypothetical protein